MKTSWNVIEIPVNEIPPRMRGPYQPLYDELVLRLERTSPGFALMVSFDDDKSAKAACNSLKKAFKAVRPDIQAFVRNHNGAAAVFVHVTNGNGHKK